MTRKIYHIEFAKTGSGMSGGETCMVELIRFLARKNEKNIILTTDNGKRVYEDLGLLESEFIEYKIINSYQDEKKYHIFIAYFKRLSKIKNILKNVIFGDDDILFCHSDFFPNSIPLYWIFKKNKNLQFFYFFHVQAPGLFYGFKGEFLKKYNVPSLSLIHYKLNQRLYLWIINYIKKGTVIAVNSFYKKYLDENIKNRNIEKYFLKVFGGVDLQQVQIQEKKYDCVWMGRFQDLKGVKEIFDIAQHLKKKKSSIKIVVIGGGNQESEEQFRENVKKFGLENNIDYKGFLNGKERFKILSSAKIFMMTSYFESYGLVNIEAMRLGLPVIAYDLPVFDVFKKGMYKVEILNNKKFSEKILEILENDDLLRKLLEEAKEFSKDYSWENTGKEIYNLIK